eukprot:jgi/Chrpa1/15868/Chrysochromulina_OHIO_Genome00012282-RA
MQSSMGFGGMPSAASSTFRMGNNSFGSSGGGSSLSGLGSMGVGSRSMSGLGSVPTPTSGLSLSGGASPQTGGLGGSRLGNNSFGAMQPAQTSYNPSGEILAMINKAQSLGLPPHQPLGMSSTLSGLHQPGLQPGLGGLGMGAGMGAGDLGGAAMGGVRASPSFDISDFPSLGPRSSATTSASMQQFRAQQDLNTLALGTDLTTLGLNLNSSECLYATFASPWADSPAQRDPEYSLPQCYYMQPPALKTGHFSKFQLETLFYIFYNMPRDTLQAYAATELYNRDWRYHKDLKLWFTKASRQGADETQRGQYIYFDINEWKKKMFHGAAGAAGAAGHDVTDDHVKGIVPDDLQ